MIYKYFNEKEDPKMIGISEDLMEMLDNAREIAGVPFIITSGVRSLAENNAVGGVEDSSHLYGLAVDLRCADSENRFHIVKGLLVAGLERIEITSDHIHADIDDKKVQNVLFFR
jgi:zinc D-Ala-D-Ala carboxypeptidase